jgi:hypothetical protein
VQKTTKIKRPDMGEYRHTKGHHVHAKKAFEGNINYDPKKGFFISNEYMQQKVIKHDDMTISQRALHKELYTEDVWIERFSKYPSSIPK